MPRPAPARKYGKQSTRSKAERLFAELPQSPVRKPAESHVVESLSEHLSTIKIGEAPETDLPKRPRRTKQVYAQCVEDPVVQLMVEAETKAEEESETEPVLTEAHREQHQECLEELIQQELRDQAEEEEINLITNGEANVSKSTKEFDSNQNLLDETNLRVLSWEDVCPPSDRIDKIAEASFAEVYRVTNERGTSIIKVIRLSSPIKAQTKAQVRSGLVDEEPHSADDLHGELQISEWLADIPGFVVYKERYIVQGKATRQLLETHQAFQKKMKRQDPDRAQFYPSPSRYLDETKFLVVELGDAGKALEDWEVISGDQLWDIFFLEAIALARAEDLVMFEHRDLHEGNLCIKQVRPPSKERSDDSGFFGHSGLDITILDYGLSRGEDLSTDDGQVVAFDLEKDLSLFTSTHAPQCKVYRQMRSFLLRADRKCLPPEEHDTPYAIGIDGPLSWKAFAPYTNVLWLAYLYEFLLEHFAGDKKDLVLFKKTTREMWKYLNPDAKNNVPCFGSATDVVCFAVEAGWIREEQMMGLGNTMLDKEDSIIVSRDGLDPDASLRRSARTKAALESE